MKKNLNHRHHHHTISGIGILTCHTHMDINSLFKKKSKARLNYTNTFKNENNKQTHIQKKENKK